MKSFRRLGPIFLLGVGVGCAPPEASISGKILYKGVRPSFGQVTFIDEQGNGMNTILRDDGSYSIRPVKTGKLRVVILSMAKLPAKYTDPKATELSVEVVPGENTYSVDLP